MKVSREPVESTSIPVQPCPACFQVLEAATGTGRPGPGTITLCAYCRTFLIFDPLMRQRVLSNAEWSALPDDQRQLLTALREHITTRRKAC